MIADVGVATGAADPLSGSPETPSKGSAQASLPVVLSPSLQAWSIAAQALVHSIRFTTFRLKSFAEEVGDLGGNVIVVPGPQCDECS